MLSFVFDLFCPPKLIKFPSSWVPFALGTLKVSGVSSLGLFSNKQIVNSQTEEQEFPRDLNKTLQRNATDIYRNHTSLVVLAPRQGVLGK
jgi:DNA polymerase III delta subunit